jgi:hypothetical protein
MSDKCVEEARRNALEGIIKSKSITCVNLSWHPTRQHIPLSTHDPLFHPCPSSASFPTTPSNLHLHLPYQPPSNAYSIALAQRENTRSSSGRNRRAEKEQFLIGRGGEANIMLWLDERCGGDVTWSSMVVRWMPERCDFSG